MSEQTAAGTQKKKHFTLPLFQRNVRYGEVDLPFFLIVIALLVIGIIMMFSASYAWAIAEGESGTYYATNQIKNALVGIVIMCILCMIDYHVFQKACGTSFASIPFGVPTKRNSAFGSCC